MEALAINICRGAIEQEMMHVMRCRGPEDQAMMHLSAPEHHMASMAAALQPEMHHQKQDQVCLTASSLHPVCVPVLPDCLSLSQPLMHCPFMVSLSPVLLCTACAAQENFQFAG